MATEFFRSRAARSHLGPLLEMGWALPLLSAIICAVGSVALFSTAGGNLEPWAGRHALRAAGGLAIMLAVGMVPPRIWMRGANIFYFVVLALLVMVPFFGMAQFGARRWLGVGEMSLQPAELMKVALVAALASYYHRLPRGRISHPLWVAVPLMMIAAPAALILKQPDLGTAVLVAATGLTVMFLAGVKSLYFVAGAVSSAALGNVIWPRLQDYQRLRLLTFLDPDRDPLGAGYHIAQSKIALGSGGIHGRGFLGGTQAQLNFLPEKHTDFIFTMLAEETGFIGGVALLVLYAALIAVLLAIAFRAGTVFSRLLAAGVAAVFALHVSVNIGMVMGLVPVVGVPLPLVSYGGTSMLTLMFALGLVLSTSIHRNERARQVGSWP